MSAFEELVTEESKSKHALAAILGQIGSINIPYADFMSAPTDYRIFMEFDASASVIVLHAKKIRKCETCGKPR